MFDTSAPYGSEKAWVSKMREELEESTTKVEYNPVTRPEHYANGNIECIDAMEEVFGLEAVVNFSLLNCFKYLWRRKDKENEEQDTQKALWYFDKAKELMNKMYSND